MRLYDQQCLACGQCTVLYGVCRMCGQLHPQPVHPLHHPNDGDDTDAPACTTDQTTAEPQNDTGPVHDFDLGAGG